MLDLLIHGTLSGRFLPLRTASEGKAKGRTFTLYVLVDAGERGLVQLAGVDPTASS